MRQNAASTMCDLVLLVSLPVLNRRQPGQASACAGTTCRAPGWLIPVGVSITAAYLQNPGIWCQVLHD